MKMIWVAILGLMLSVLCASGGLAAWSLDHFQSKSEAQSMSTDIREIRLDVKELLKR